MGNVKTLNPIASTDEDTYFISKLVYDSLFVLDGEMVPQNSLVKDYEINQKDGTMTIDLVTTNWHDGKPFTGHDVEFTVRAYQSMGSNSQYSSLIDRIDDVEVESDSRIVIDFDSNTRMSMNSLTFPIVPEHVFDSVSDALAPDADFIPIGTGQYSCKSYSKTDKLSLVANEEYFGKKAKNNVTFEIIPQRATMYSLLEAGSVSLLVSRDPARKTTITKKGIDIVDFLPIKWSISVITSIPYQWMIKMCAKPSHLLLTASESLRSATLTVEWSMTVSSSHNTWG